MERTTLTALFIIFCFLLQPKETYGNPENPITNNPTAKPRDTSENGKRKYFVLPFHLTDGFILVDATINGTSGKLMFDTGTPFSFFLNNNKIHLDKTNKIAEGQAGSGQEIVLFKSDSLVSINLSGNREHFLEQRPIHANFDFIEHGITAEFLGFIGHGFIEDYEFTIDYDNQVMEFFLIDKNGERIEGSKKPTGNTVGVINFKNDASANIPEFELEIGSTSIPAYVDTGDQGHLKLTSKTKNSFLDKNLMEVNGYSAWYGNFYGGKHTVNLKEPKTQGISIKKLKNLGIDEDENKINLGYQFLKLYKTIWNFKKKTITLMER